MNEPSHIALEFLKIIINFLSENILYILLGLSLYLFREAISGFISRLISFNFTNGDASLGLQAATPSAETGAAQAPVPTDETLIRNDNITDADQDLHRGWFISIYDAFKEGRFEEADKLYKKFSLEERDENKLLDIKSYYLYSKYTYARDESAIRDLENLAITIKDDTPKFDCLEWLSFCLIDSLQYKKCSEMWHSFIETATEENIKTKAIISMAHAISKNGNPGEAKRHLSSRLKDGIDTEQQSALYRALSEVETVLDNKLISVYCRDKSLEFDANNTSELFKSAYAASNESANFISISNYSRLVDIDDKNDIALNNLGVEAKESKLNIVSTDNYRESTYLNNTLAMANQGFALLHAGFALEAEELANKAITLGEPHSNVYLLKTEIEKAKEKQYKEWSDLKHSCIRKQNALRKYTEQYYKGESNSLEGEWFVDGLYSTSLSIKNESIEGSWIEAIKNTNAATCTVKLIGKVSGSTITATLTRTRNEKPAGLLSASLFNSEQLCIGFLSDDKETLSLISEKMGDNFHQELSRVKPSL
ncbi:hypothetical protein [Aeromonas hydrophila]|uniref:hypothetical protein n=1 Tax=Aeromonas hydrophila TaxID=644 RepID=UPI0002E09BC9|nr:hypothetical protein [Aeromonas hydrophila]